MHACACGCVWERECVYVCIYVRVRAKQRKRVCHTRSSIMESCVYIRGCVYVCVSVPKPEAAAWNAVPFVTLFLLEWSISSLFFASLFGKCRSVSRACNRCVICSWHCIVLQCVAVCCSVLQCVAVRVCVYVFLCVCLNRVNGASFALNTAVCCSVLQCVAVSCSVCVCVCVYVFLCASITNV